MVYLPLMYNYRILYKKLITFGGMYIIRKTMLQWYEIMDSFVHGSNYYSKFWRKIKIPANLILANYIHHKLWSELPNRLYKQTIYFSIIPI